MIPFPFRQIPDVPPLQPETILALATKSGGGFNGGRTVLGAEKIMGMIRANEPVAWNSRVTIGRTGGETDTFIPIYPTCILICRRRKRITTTLIRGKKMPELIWVQTMVAAPPIFAAEEWRIMASDPCAGIIPNKDE